MRRIAISLSLVFFGCRGGAAPWETAPPPEEIEAPVTQVTSGRAGEDKDPEVSSDGKLLFYASSSFGENLDLFVKEIGATTVTRLTRMPGDDRFPKVNPADPRMLAFCSNDRGTWEIYVMPDWKSDPGKTEIVSEPGAHSIHPSWSPDGRFLAYCSAERLGAGEWTLKILDRVGGKTHILEDIDGLLPEWSPRGNRIVFQRMKHRDRWFSALWTLDWEGGTIRNLTSIFSSDDWAAINPSWSPDGKRIVFATVGKSLSRAGTLEEGDDLWTVREDGSLPTRLTVAPEADWMPAWAVDGRVYFVSRRSGADRIWSLQPRLPEDP